ncbi:MAG: hypothetical protein AAGE76_16440 [Pseudomonadota bacterium]
MLGAGLCLATPAWAVDSGTVDRFVRLSARFHAQLPNSDVTGLSGAAQRTRAVCILSRFESAFGSGGVQALMNLMSVLSQGAEFDDPTIIAFNDRFGSAYDRTERDCTRAALSS